MVLVSSFACFDFGSKLGLISSLSHSPTCFFALEFRDLPDPKCLSSLPLLFACLLVCWLACTFLGRNSTQQAAARRRMSAVAIAQRKAVRVRGQQVAVQRPSEIHRRIGTLNLASISQFIRLQRGRSDSTQPPECWQGCLISLAMLREARA